MSEKNDGSHESSKDESTASVDIPMIEPESSENLPRVPTVFLGVPMTSDHGSENQLHFDTSKPLPPIPDEATKSSSFRERLDRKLPPITRTETGPGLLSSHMSTSEPSHIVPALSIRNIENSSDRLGQPSASTRAVPVAQNPNPNPTSANFHTTSAAALMCTSRASLSRAHGEIRAGTTNWRLSSPRTVDMRRSSGALREGGSISRRGPSGRATTSAQNDETDDPGTGSRETLVLRQNSMPAAAPDVSEALRSNSVLRQISPGYRRSLAAASDPNSPLFGTLPYPDDTTYPLSSPDRRTMMVEVARNVRRRMQSNGRETYQVNASPVSQRPPSISEPEPPLNSMPPGPLSSYMVRILFDIQIAGAAVWFIIIIINTSELERLMYRGRYQSTFLIQWFEWIKVSLLLLIYPLFIAFPVHLDAFLQHIWPEYSFANILPTPVVKVIKFKKRKVLPREVVDRLLQCLRLFLFFISYLMAIFKAFSSQYPDMQPLKNSKPRQSRDNESSKAARQLAALYNPMLWHVLLPFWLGMLLYLVPLFMKISHTSQINRIMQKASSTKVHFR